LNGITYIIIVLVKCRCYLERELRHTDTANGVGGASSEPRDPETPALPKSLKYKDETTD